MMRTALITGATGRIGRALALDLARAGWNVGATWRSDEAKARSLEDALAPTGVPYRIERCDLARPDTCAELVERVEDHLGPIDALVHAAGTFTPTHVLDETPEGFARALDDDLRSLFHIADRVQGGMRERGFGRIVAFAIAGAGAVRGRERLAAHYVSKVGVLALVRAYSRALAPYGVTANVVSPGVLGEGPDAEMHLSAIPAGRLGTPSDAVAAVRFLLSDEAGYVTGAEIPVSGGFAM